MEKNAASRLFCCRVIMLIHGASGMFQGNRQRGKPRRRRTDHIKYWSGRTVAECTRSVRD